MLRKICIVFVLVFLSAASVTAQCPSLITYQSGNGGKNNCPGVLTNPIDADFTGGPYEYVPVSTKTGNITAEWTSRQVPTPAIQAFFNGNTLLADTAGPASPQDSTAPTNFESKYCIYGPVNLANNGNFSIFWVDPQTDTALYSCSYNKSGSNITFVQQPSITVQPTDKYGCVGFPVTFSVTGAAANGGALSYQWRKNGINITSETNATYTISSFALSDTGRYSVFISELNEGVILSDEVTLYSTGLPWTGASDTDWNTATNWENGVVPSSSTHVLIANTANEPTIATGTVNCQCITVAAGANLNVDGGELAISGEMVTQGGTITANNGSITMNGTTAQTLPDGMFAGDSILNLTINNSAGVTMADTVNLIGTLTPTAGTLITGDNLRVINNSEGCGCIGTGATGGGYISGNVIMERYIPGGTRAFRFLTHPFSTSLSLSVLTDDVDITGKGGSSNGFTNTKSNNPSAFWFDVSAADTSTSGSNAGWTAFESADPDSAFWDQYETIRVLVRGTPGQGLLGTNYTPQPTTLDISSTINQGNQTITLTKGASSEFVLSGNPFPCGIQMNTLTVGSDIGANYTVWDANQGVRGGYTSVPFATSYIMPPYGSFVAIVSANSNNTITVEEADKSDATAVSLFKNTANTKGYTVQLRMYDSSTFWDRVLLTYDSSAMRVEDKMDAIKLYNPNIDFYTISADTTRLSIDARPYKDNDVIPLGVVVYNRYGDYYFEVPDYDVEPGVQLYFEDRYLNKSEPLKEGFTYKFTVTADTNSQGIDRFAIRQSGMPAVNITEAKMANALIQIVPNPTIGGNVKVSYNNISGSGTLRVVNISGITVYTHDIEEGSGSTIIPADDLPAGVYIIEVSGDNARYSQKLIRR